MPNTACILTGPESDKKLLGLTLLERQLLSLSRAGFTRLFVVAAPDGPVPARLAASKALARKGIAPRLLVKKTTAALPAAGGSVLVVPAGAVFDWKGAATLVTEKKAKVVYLDLQGRPGISLLPVASANTLVRNHLAGKAAASGGGKGIPFPGWGLVADAVNNRRQARRELLVSMRKPTDGFVSRHLNRYVSLFLTRFFLILRLSPNAISFGNLGLGIFGALLVALGGYANTLVAGIIFQFTSIVDGCDGEVAKLAFRDSDKGAWIDTICDQLGYFTFFIGLPIGLYRQNTANPLYLILGVLTFVSIAFLFWLMSRYVRRRGAGGSMLLILQDIEAAAKGPGGFGLVNRIVFGMSFVFRRDFFAFFAMVFCAATIAWVLQWLITAAVTLMACYLVFFSWYTEKKRAA